MDMGATEIMPVAFITHHSSAPENAHRYLTSRYLGRFLSTEIEIQCGWPLCSLSTININHQYQDFKLLNCGGIPTYLVGMYLSTCVG